ncbi:MAG: ATP-binding cassette domain-containing protein [Ilumatobacteraceae bacterium]
MTAALLEVEDLRVAFAGRAVVDGVSLRLDPGDRLGIIGESGSGKTLTALAVLGLAPEAATISGSVRLDGQELLGRRDRQVARLRGRRVSMVFQDPRTALNPVMRVGRQISEPLRLHLGLGRRDAAAAAEDWCARVGLPDPQAITRAYPHQLSGGQRQRVGIAMALAGRPAVLIADEPTTALDVTVQAEIMALLRELVDQDGTALVFISHDLALVSSIAEDIVVMRDGRVVERGDAAAMVHAPQQDYTRRLLAAARLTSLQT